MRYYNNAVFDRLELKGRIGVGGVCGKVNKGTNVVGGKGLWSGKG